MPKSINRNFVWSGGVFLCGFFFIHPPPAGGVSKRHLCLSKLPLKNNQNNYLTKLSCESDTQMKNGNDCNICTSLRLAAKQSGTPQATLVQVEGGVGFYTNSKFYSCSWNGKYSVYLSYLDCKILNTWSRYNSILTEKSISETNLVQYCLSWP